MKKILYSVMAIAALTFSFTSLTSCEDVPAPYEIPGGGEEKPSTPEVAPAGTGKQEAPFNVAGALQYIENGGDENAEVYVKGKVVSVQSGSFDPSYGSLKYYISDDGTSTNQFLVYNGYAGPNRTKFTSEDALKPGDVVVICGKLVTYNGTKEFTTGNYIVSINGNGGSTDVPPTDVPTDKPTDKPDSDYKPDSGALTIDGTTVTLANLAATPGTESVSLDCSTLGYTNGQDAETITFSDGTTLSFDKNGETNGAKYYDATKGFRIYKNNKLTFTGIKPIAQIILTCDSYNGADYVGNNTATVAVSGNSLVYTNVFTGTSGGGVQLRIKNIKIVYAK